MGWASGLVLANTIQQNWWKVTSKVRLQKTAAATPLTLTGPHCNVRVLQGSGAHSVYMLMCVHRERNKDERKKDRNKTYCLMLRKDPCDCRGLMSPTSNGRLVTHGGMKVPVQRHSWGWIPSLLGEASLCSIQVNWLDEAHCIVDTNLLYSKCIHVDVTMHK